MRPILVAIVFAWAAACAPGDMDGLPEGGEIHDGSIPEGEAGTGGGVEPCGTRPCPTPVVAAACVLAGDPSGQSDSTDALIDAMQCAIDNGYLPVRVPKGTFALAQKVVVPPRVALVGEPEGSFGVNGPPVYDSLPMLRFAAGLTDDALVLSTGSSITGIQLRASGQKTNGKAVLAIGGPSVEIRNVKITDGHWGIYAGAVDAKGLIVSDVFMVAPEAGVYVAKATGHVLLENIHVWNNRGSQGQANAFVIGAVSNLDA
ncbi:MAG: hypothetical protein KC416_03300, partial [Myxococcales bacterium]|nr:hypothetical protein [Myxococcales bacterium]